MTRRMDVDAIRAQVETCGPEDLIEATTAVVEWLLRQDRSADGSTLPVNGDVILDIIAEQVGVNRG